jgi:hypothetical protein
MNWYRIVTYKELVPNQEYDKLREQTLTASYFKIKDTQPRNPAAVCIGCVSMN